MYPLAYPLFSSIANARACKRTQSFYIRPTQENKTTSLKVSIARVLRPLKLNASDALHHTFHPTRFLCAPASSLKDPPFRAPGLAFSRPRGLAW